MDQIKKYRRVFVFFGSIILILLLNCVYDWSGLLTNPEQLPALQAVLRENRFKAILIYIGLTILGSVLLALPGVVFAFAAGVLFGPVWGTIACSLATTMGASLAFLTSRYFLHDAVKPWAMSNQYISRLFFEERGNKDLFLLMITRLVPIFPYNLQNFAYGLTDIGFWPFTLYSLVFMIPGTAAYVIAASGLADKSNRSLYFGISGILLAAVFLISYFLKKHKLSLTNKRKEKPRSDQ